MFEDVARSIRDYGERLDAAARREAEDAVAARERIRDLIRLTNRLQEQVLEMRTLLLKPPPSVER